MMATIVFIDYTESQTHENKTKQKNTLVQFPTKAAEV